MGLFSKILKGAGSELNLDKIVKAVSDAAEKIADKADGQGNARPSASVYSNSQSYSPAPASGFSWGDEMPAEENQYNYPGSYIQYFQHVFEEDFPQYQIVYERLGKRPLEAFSFYEGGRKVLVVEIKSENSEAQWLRRVCATEGTPYLRFYYNHDGWWNTREYVDTRVRQALGL